ncbi:phospholipase A2 group XV-like [Ochlerotatus camptorhynchus]|uniref:phospholipase A2 group XV-like n=1 Tax=Ochlerotatus camptorhynchus TaxID=644619 RepID=UPI0031CEC24E
MKCFVSLIFLQLLASVAYGIHTFTIGRIPYIEDIGSKLQPLNLSRDPDKIPSPVILVPGLGGSRLEAKLDKPSRVSFLCSKKTDAFYDIWLNVENLAPFAINCLSDNLRLVYNNESRTTESSPGVTVQVAGWGYSDAVEWLCRSRSSRCAYYVNLVDTLVANGYIRGFSVQSAPYDFRLPYYEFNLFYTWLTKEIEGAFELNSDTPVTLIVHSMGGPMVLQFLQGQPQEWKDKYIKRVISLNGAWGGTVKSLKVYAMGDDLGSWIVSSSALRALQITTPSLAWMMPNPLFWKPQTILAKTKTKVYTLENLQDFYEDIDFPLGWEMYQDVLPYVKNFTAPGVEIYCFYGTNVPTIEQLDYGEAYELTGTPEFIQGDGDGTINRISLEACKYWASEQKQPVHVREYSGVGHMEILGDLKVLRDILEIQMRDLM